MADEVGELIERADFYRKHKANFDIGERLSTADDLIGEMATAIRALRMDRDAVDEWFAKTVEDDTPLVRWSDGTWSWGYCGHWQPGGYATARDAIEAGIAAMAAESARGEGE